MASVNKVILIGNLGRDPELRYNPNGVAFCSISLATTRNWKDRESGEKREETEWHRVVFNDKLAEIVGEYCKKGRPVYVEGRLRTRKWTDKEGKEVYTTEVIANEMQLLGSREDGGRDGESEAPARQGAPQQRQGQGTPRRFSQPGSAASYGSAGGADPRPATGFDDMDDDIPYALNACDWTVTPGKTRRLGRASF